MSEKRNYYINENDEFVIRNYNNQSPFSGFLPAVAGVFGKPLWAFYVNRGQCMSSIGVNNRDSAIMEFYGAAKAYMQTSRQGFRTFVKIKNKNNNQTPCYEPFQNNNYQADRDVEQNMYISSHALKIEDVNKQLGIKCTAEYITLPNEEIAGLIRHVRIENISSEDLEIDLLDGIPFMIPYGRDENTIKLFSNLCQTYMAVQHQDDIPYYNVPVLPADSIDEMEVKGGNYYINISFDEAYLPVRNKTIIDPKVIFDEVTDFSYPKGFYSEDFSIPKKQVDSGKNPCAFGYLKAVISPNSSKDVFVYMGYSDTYENVKEFYNKIDYRYTQEKFKENKLLIENIKSPALVCSGSKEFDLYSGQTFLDNALRGGMPISIGGQPVYVFGRRHADMEREYNKFQIDSTYFSQGNGNYRDLNQNRRSDTYFFDNVMEHNIKLFFDFIQFDGFNTAFRLKAPVYKFVNKEIKEVLLQNYINGKKTIDFFGNEYTVGALFEFIRNNDSVDEKDEMELAESILENSQIEYENEPNIKFFVDHWTYNIDLIQQYYRKYPDLTKDLLFEKKEFSYYDSFAKIMPRHRKYKMAEGLGVRQMDAVLIDEEKANIIEKRDHSKNKVHTKKGEVYYGTLIAKIVCLLTNKIASLDASGVGVEMEAGNCGWNDSLNLLPTVFGSSINESAEIKRFVELLLEIFETVNINEESLVFVPEEVSKFYGDIKSLLISEKDTFTYWDLSNEAKEEFREKTFYDISGIEEGIKLSEIIEYFNLINNKIAEGLDKAYNKDAGMYYTYYCNYVEDYERLVPIDGEGVPRIKVKSFFQKPLPYFLEGPMHILRLKDGVEKQDALYKSIRESELFDKNLNMYLTSADLSQETKELGRIASMPKGWLENENVFMHMEYKYLLEVLNYGLVDEFYQDIETMLVPFLDAKTYGRSITEHSSFIVSSVHKDRSIHGKGYQARLTGTTAEFLSMLIIMTVGKKQFYLGEDKELLFEFDPKLNKRLFTSERTCRSVYIDGNKKTIELNKNQFAFMLHGKTLTVYNNPQRKNTYGKYGARIKDIKLIYEDKEVKIDGALVREPHSKDIRDTKLVKKIEINLE